MVFRGLVYRYVPLYLGSIKSLPFYLLVVLRKYGVYNDSQYGQSSIIRNKKFLGGGQIPSKLNQFQSLNLKIPYWEFYQYLIMVNLGLVGF